MGDEQFDCAMDLMRRLPPQKVETFLSDLIDLKPEMADDLLSAVDCPLKMKQDQDFGGKYYLLCDYNREGDSYRSPWTNTYNPPVTHEDAQYPSERTRQLEIEFNNAFEEYRRQYYEGGISSVYLWDSQDYDQGFAGVFLIKKESDKSDAIQGSWDSIHVIDVREKIGAKNISCQYKLTSIIMLWLKTNKEDSGVMDLGGTLSRQTELDASVSDTHGHIVHIGKMIEEMENSMRNGVQEIYFDKTKKVINDLRSTSSAEERSAREKLSKQIGEVVSSRR